MENSKTGVLLDTKKSFEIIFKDQGSKFKLKERL